jgi:gamma-glutamyltranspeptidase
LEQRGHKLKIVDNFGATQAVAFDFANTNFLGATDPRGLGQTRGW